MPKYGGTFECPSGLHGNVWCTCPAPRPLEPLPKRKPFEGVDTEKGAYRPAGTCHECSEAFKEDEPLITLMMPPRFRGEYRLLHLNCSLRVLARVEFKQWH